MPDHESEFSHLSSAEVRNPWSLVLALHVSYFIMEWCVVKHVVQFMFKLGYSIL